jgi:superfamily II DNA/RNA helicase
MEEIKNSNEQWIIWCGLNQEQDEICKALDKKEVSYTSVYGSLTPDEKEKRIISFTDGCVKVLVTKASVAGFGMNFQNAHNMVFVGLGDSWEMYYQCIRREYRFGQKNPVNVYVILSEIEREIWENVMHKEAMARRMTDELISRIKQYEMEELQNTADKEEKDKPEKEMKVPAWLYKNISS